MKNYKLKICIRCGKEFIPMSPTQKYCSECRVISYKEKKKQWSKSYRLEHLEQEKEHNKARRGQKNQYSKSYYYKHLEQRKQYAKSYYLAHLEYYKQQRRLYCLEHPEQKKQYNKSYHQTPRGKQASIRHFNKRKRDLGFIPLNSYKSYKEGYVFHHNDKTGYGVYMLEEDHDSIHHNVFTGKGMAEMNALAFNYLGS